MINVDYKNEGFHNPPLFYCFDKLCAYREIILDPFKYDTCFQPPVNNPLTLRPLFIFINCHGVAFWLLKGKKKNISFFYLIPGFANIEILGNCEKRFFETQ